MVFISTPARCIGLLASGRITDNRKAWSDQANLHTKKSTGKGRVAAPKVGRRCCGRCCIRIGRRSIQPLLHLGRSEIASTHDHAYFFAGKQVRLRQQGRHSGCTCGFHHEAG